MTPSYGSGNETRPRRMKAKVCLIGEQSCGKTELVRPFVSETFDRRYLRTLGAIVSKKGLKLPNPRDGEVFVDLLILDILGEKRFLRMFGEAYMDGSSGILAVCDASSKTTFEDLDEWMESVHRVTGRIPTVLAINRRVSSAPERVTDSDAKQFAMRYEAPYFYTSSETGENVDAAFNALGTRVVEDRLGPIRGSSD